MIFIICYAKSIAVRAYKIGVQKVHMLANIGRFKKYVVSAEGELKITTKFFFSFMKAVSI